MASTDNKLTYEELLQKTKDQECEIIRLSLKEDTRSNLDFFFKESNDLCCLAGTDGFYKEINQGFTKILGYSKEELLTKPLIAFIHPDDLEMSNVEMETLLQGFSTANFKNRLLKKNGEIVYMQWTSNFNVSHDVIYIIGRDITEIKNAQSELLESNSQLENTQKISKTGSWEYNFKSHKMRWSDELYYIYKLKKKDNQDLFQEYVNLFSDSDVNILLNKIKDSKINKEPFEIEQCAVLNKNKTIWVHAIVQPILDEEGEVIALTGTTQDITEKKQIREILKLRKKTEVTEKLKKVEQESNAKFKGYLEKSPDGIFITDENGNFLEVNNAVSLISGYSTEELLTLSMMELIYEDSVEDIEICFNKVKKIGESKGEFKTIHKSGEIRWSQVDSVKLSNTRYIGFIKDITDIKRSNELLVNTFERITDAFIALDNNWCYTYMNKTAGEILGCNPQEMIGKHIWTEFPERIDKPFYKASYKAINEQIYIYLEEHFEPYDLWFENHIYPSKNGLSIFFRDISENKIANQKLQKANRLYLFISHINQMIARATDQETLFKEACNIAIKIGGFKMAWIGLIDSDSTKVITTTIAGTSQEYLKLIKPIKYDKNTPEGNGPAVTSIRSGTYCISNDIETDLIMRPWKNEALACGFKSIMALPIKKSNEIIGVFTLYSSENNFFDLEEIELLEEATRDITYALDFLEKEKKVFESEKRYHTLTEVSPVGIFRTDTKGFTTFVNPSWCEISGISYKEAVGRGWLNAVYEKDKFKLLNNWKNTKNKGKKSMFEFRFVRPDGSISWVIGQSIPEKNENNEIIGYIGTITDITISKELEAKLIITKEVAESANKSKTNFLANMSHEIRTPLNGIIGFTNLLMKTNLDSNQLDYMSTINVSANLLLDIVNDVLDFSKIESGKLELFIEKFDLYKLINQIVELFKYQAITKKIDLILNIEENVPQFIKADSIKIKQILVNLLSNSFKFTEFGEVRLEVKSLNLSNEDISRLKFSVIDTGKGIKLINNKKIFSSFEQEDNSTNRKYGGTGLGLAISNQLLALMDSKLELKSIYSEGSDFYFSIDVKKASNQISKKQKLTTIFNENDIEITESSEVKKILIAEDNKINMLLIKTLVKKIVPNSIILSAFDGSEAIEQFLKEQPDLILMDIQMPIKNGYEAAAEIRKLNPTNRIPIIAVTAGILSGEKDKCFEAGMDDYLPKPIVFSDIERIMLKWIN
jgi:PAS domain S-box-containing protein